MKKFASIFIAAAFALIMTACSSGNTPTSVASKAIECIQDKDYEGYVDLMHFNVDEDESLDEKKQEAVAMVQGKVSKSIEKKGGITSYEVISEEISPEGDKAVVTMKLVYGDGDEKDDTMKLVKDDSGNWMLDSGK